MAAEARRADAGLALRPPSEVMRLARLGSFFATRLSFMPTLIRRLSREAWRIGKTVDALDAQGLGHAVYEARGPRRVYSLIAFAHALEPNKRTDRVIAEAWDASFVLFDGVPGLEDIARLKANAPRQEAGRYSPKDLVLSRANRSLRLFDHVTERLSRGSQPDLGPLGSTGYLMRTTAVYGNGKFGLADRGRIADRPELAGPFQAEMLAVYLIRCFTLDLVEHIAQARNRQAAAPLDRKLRRFLGIGNATGLGMAPFLITHPALINNWILARETALARVRALPSADAGPCARFQGLLDRAIAHVGEWQVADAVQSARLAALSRELAGLRSWLDQRPDPLGVRQPWDALFRRAHAALGLEAQELLVSLLLEPHGDLIDDLTETMGAGAPEPLDPAMRVAELRDLVERLYGWALAIDFADRAATARFWYVSQEKLEPRLGERHEEPGAELELPLAVGVQIQALYADLARAEGQERVALFALAHPEHRAMIRRAQSVARHPYGEIRDNIISGDCRPIDLLRCKLSFFGASKFDPKSDRWTRITLYQGAPLPDELHEGRALDWAFPALKNP